MKGTVKLNFRKRNNAGKNSARDLFWRASFPPQKVEKKQKKTKMMKKKKTLKVKEETENVK